MAALEKEIEENQNVLFPIYIDTHIFHTRKKWVKNIAKNRFIGNFSNWQDKSLYKKSLKKLLKDLVQD